MSEGFTHGTTQRQPALRYFTVSWKLSSDEWSGSAEILVSRAFGGRESCAVFPHGLLEPLIRAIYISSGPCSILDQSLSQNDTVHILCFLESVT